MENPKANQMIEQVIKNVNTKEVIYADIAEELIEIRAYALEEQNPTVVKALRLCAEHLKENESFLIDIPNDDPIDEESDTKETSINSKESLHYFLSLLLDLNNKHNMSDLREFNKKMTNYA